MTDLPTWEVRLLVEGSIKVDNTINLEVLKGFQGDRPFYSKIILKNAASGIEAFLTASASTSDLAHKAALIFFGQMLDPLALEIKQPLFLSFSELEVGRRATYAVRRVVEKREWKTSFYTANQLSEQEPTFLRALGWYRKGLYSEDPFDRFLAFWNSIEVTATKYHPKTEKTSSGSINQIWACFESLWGDCDSWPDLIRGETDWIDKNYKTRKDIAHGITRVNIHDVESVIERLKIIEEISQTFLSGWLYKKIQRSDHLESLVDYILENPLSSDLKPST